MLKRTLGAWNSMSAMFLQDTRTIPLAELKERYQLTDSDFVNIKGLNVHYRDNPCRQNPDAPVLLCLHGIFSSLHTWQKWIDELNDRFRIITIDLPNFGLTGPFPNTKLDDNSYPDFLCALLDILKIAKCHLAGNSLGGFFSYSFAAKYPERVEKMILLDSAGFLFIPPLALISWGLPLAGWLVENSNPPKPLVSQLIRQAYAKEERASEEELTRYYEMMMRPGNSQGGSKI
jgi:pimeloyl-ACP methyl ester carboxylesterase